MWRWCAGGGGVLARLEAWGAVKEDAVGSSLKVLRRALDSGTNWGCK